MVFRLCYFSTNLIPRATDPRATGLRNLVMVAGSNNRSLGITGGLIFNGNYFAQVLEGDRSQVSGLFGKISRDPRHTSVVLVDARDVETRSFERWSMGFADVMAASDDLNIKYGCPDGFEPNAMSAASFCSYLLDMVSREETRVAVSMQS